MQNLGSDGLVDFIFHCYNTLVSTQTLHLPPLPVLSLLMMTHCNIKGLGKMI